ncbi:MAG: hypothetical protein LR017_00155 [Candidatus Pacebacteria bacterium]|nr:hypothetical protein [Candidatus Paceibacterota bacterium]
MQAYTQHYVGYLMLVCAFFVGAYEAHAQVSMATTTLTVSICGDFIVNENEDCDVADPLDQYSTTIAGRTCTAACQWAPYCGDAILQTIYGEECDDGNNIDGDFCAADCTEEDVDSGGGSSGGGGSSSSGGSNTELGDTEVVVEGKAYPQSTVRVLIDGVQDGTVRANSQGEFLYTTDTEPGTTSFSFWANDSEGTRSSTFNTTFDVTQGAVTNVNGILIPPTLRVSETEIDPGDQVTLSGQSIPNATIEISIDDDADVFSVTTDSSGNWSFGLNTAQLSIGTHTIKVRFVEGSSTLKTESSYGTTVSLFVGVEGQPANNSDLNRDGSVNLVDFSILVFWWGTNGGNSNPPADINQNGNVGLEDFSILLFNWTG